MSIVFTMETVQNRGVTEHTGDHAAHIDPRAHRVLADVSRVAVLETLRKAGRPLSIPEIATAVGLHPNTVRAHLALLVEHGYATGSTEDRDRPGRPRLLYAATPQPASEEERRNYRLLAEVLLGYLSSDPETRAKGGAAGAVAAGRAYGRRVADAAGNADRPLDAATATQRIIALLRDAGFDPRLATDGVHIELRRCPFQELAESHPDLVCGVHLGLMQGALADLGAPITAAALRPFIRPGVCVAALRPTPQASR